MSTSSGFGSSTNNDARPKSTIERRACVDCHRRKIRCDAPTAGFPCKNCQLLNRTDCRPHEKKKRARRSAINSRPTLPSPIAPQPPPPPPTTQSLHLSDDNTTAQGPGSDSHSQGRGGTTSLRSTLSPRESSESFQAKRHLAEFFGKEDLNDKPIGVGVRLCYVGTDVSNLHFLVRQRGRSESVHHFPTLQFSRRLTTHEPDLIPQEAFILPDKALVDELIRAYFTHVAPGFPIIDESLFMAQYNSRNPADRPSLLVLQAILLVGAHVSKPQPERDALKTMFFRRAKLLFDSRHEPDRLFVVQAALLLTWHSDGAEDITANCWHYVGIASRTAFGLGMHCDVKPSKLVPHDKRTWRRVWWILVQFDVLISLSYGRPQSINLEDCNVPPLNPSDFEGCNEHTKIDYVIKHTELCVLISTILRARAAASRNPERRRQVLHRADEALADWFIHLPENLQLKLFHLDLWPALLHVTYNNFLIVLHRPQPFTSSEVPDYGPNDSDICGEASGTIVAITEELRQTDLLKYSWISSVDALFTTMIQVNAELRLSNPVLAITSLKRFDSTILSLRYLSEYWFSGETILRLFEEKSEAMQNHPINPIGIGMIDGRPWRSQVSDHPPASDNIPETTQQQQQQGSDLDWRQLFSFLDTDREPSRPAPIEEEQWRELYWQDISLPGIGNDFPLDM